MKESNEREIVLVKDGLDGLAGNAGSVSMLKKAIAQGKLAHAYIFTGPVGVGKRTAACALCQALHCKKKPFTGCGVCSTCSRIQRGLHPDYVVVEPERKWILVNSIRELSARIELGSFEGSAVVAVVNRADSMNTAAANALLKTLEEPRPGTYLILTTAALHSLPATVRSRCRMLRFGPLEEEQIKKIVKERTVVDDERAAAAARMAEGSLGRAFELSEEEGWKADRDRIVELVRKVGVHPTPEGLFELSEDLVKNIDDLKPFLDGLRRAFRDLVWWGLEGGAYRRRVLDPELIKLMPGDIIGRPPLTFLTWMRVVDRSLSALRANANRRLTMEQMVIELAER